MQLHHTEAPTASPLNGMVIVTEYELIENLEKGVFEKSAEQIPGRNIYKLALGLIIIFYKNEVVTRGHVSVTV